MNKDLRNILLIFVFSFVLRIFFMVFVSVRFWDETVYLSLARDLSSNFLHYNLAGSLWSDYIPFGNSPYYWPNIGFRAPLLPYSLSIFNYLKISSLSVLFIPIISSFSSVAVYFLGKKIFNEKVGFYSAILFSFVPINVLWGFRISTGAYGVFFLLLSFLFFWKGFEEGDNKSKIFFGIFLALALLARYTIIWAIPVFLIYFLVRDKNLKILKDKYLWFSIIAFFVVLIPWFIYGIHSYSNPLGPFIHGTLGSSFWGGTETILFYLKYYWRIFSIVGVAFIFSLFYVIRNKLFKDKKIFLFLLWFFFFFIVASFVPHKEERFLLIIVPPLCILTGLFISKLKFLKKFSVRKRKWIVSIFFILLLLVSLIPTFVTFYGQEVTGTNKCLSKSMNFIKSLPEDSLIYSDESPVVYYYTDKKTRFYPNPWDKDKLEYGKNVYILYSSYDKPLFVDENVIFRDDLRNHFEEIFSCDEDWGISEVYYVGEKQSSIPSQQS